MKLFIALAVLWINVGVVFAQSVPYTSDKIKIDGHFIHLYPQDKHLGEPVWHKAAIIKGLSYTRTYALHDENYLYLGFICSGEDQTTAKTLYRTRDNHAMWKDSCIEIFLKVEKNEYQFICNSIGAVSDLKNASYASDFNIKTHAIWDKWTWKDWYLEVAIPIAELDPSGNVRDWGYNFCRTIWNNGKMKSVSLVPRGSFKKMALIGKYGNSRRISISSPNIEASPGDHFSELTLKNKKAYKGVVGISAETISPTGVIINKNTEYVTHGKSIESVKFKYSFGTEEGLYRFTVRVLDPTGAILASATHYYMLKKEINSIKAYLDSNTYFGNAKQAILTINLSGCKPGIYLKKIIAKINMKKFNDKKSLLQTDHICKDKLDALSLPINKLKPGMYQVTTQIIDKTTNKVLSEIENRFTKSNVIF